MAGGIGPEKSLYLMVKLLRFGNEVKPKSVSIPLSCLYFIVQIDFLSVLEENGYNDYACFKIVACKIPMSKLASKFP